MLLLLLLLLLLLFVLFVCFLTFLCLDLAFLVHKSGRDELIPAFVVHHNWRDQLTPQLSAAHPCESCGSVSNSKLNNRLSMQLLYYDAGLKKKKIPGSKNKQTTKLSQRTIRFAKYGIFFLSAHPSDEAKKKKGKKIPQSP